MPALTELHWARVQYKLCLLIHLATIGKTSSRLHVELAAASLWTFRAVQSYDRPAMNNYSYHARD